MCYKLNPEATPECKICTARQYRLGCKGRDVCGIFSDIRGTHEGIKRLWEKRVREEMHSTIEAEMKREREIELESVARAYNRGEGFIELYWGTFVYHGVSYDYDVIARKAYELR